MTISNMLARGVALSGLLALALAASPAHAIDVTMAISSEPSTLDPQKTFDGGERRINDNVYEALLERNLKGELSPMLATALPARINDTTWQFKLRQGVKFHNGEPFNADAVVYSVTRIFDPDYKSTGLGDLTGIKGATKVDDYTVNIVTTRLDTLLPSRMYWLKIVPPTGSKNADFAQKPIGTGAYRLTEWVRGDHITLEKNADYWRDKPQIDRARYRFIPESGTALAGLIAGELDFVDNLPSDYVKRAPAYAARHGLEHSFALISSISGPTKDKRVRQALNYAVDKDALAKGLFEGFAAPARGQMIGDQSFGFNKSLQPWPYDPAKARALLKEAGAEGATVEFVVPASRWPKTKEMGEAIAGFWQAVGLKPNLQILEFSQYLNRLRDRNVRPDVLYASHNNALLEAERTMTGFYLGVKAGGNSSSIEDADINTWIAQAATEADNPKREALYNQIIQRGYDEAYFLFLLQTDDIYGLSKRMAWEPRLDNKVFLSEMKVK